MSDLYELREIFSPNDLKACGFDIVKFIGKGDIAGGVYRLADGKVLKIYRTMEKGNKEITHLYELDITSRLIHPAIVKTIDIILPDKCPIFKYNKYFNHGLIMDYIECIDNVPDLLAIVNGCIGITLLLENGIAHTDFHYGNQCFTNNSYVIIDINSDERINYKKSRSYTDTYETIFACVMDCLRVSQESYKDLRRYYLKKGPLPKKLIFDNLDLSPSQYRWYSDLVFRLSSPRKDVLLDLYEIPQHPIFRQLKYDLGAEESRVYDPNFWPARNFDYITPLRNILSRSIWLLPHKRSEVLPIFQALDLYYRYLPLVKTEDELPTVIDICFYLFGIIVSKNKMDWNKYYQIIYKVRGWLGLRNFYHKCMCTNDFLVAWDLMGIPYDDYMKINPDRFYEVVSPAYSGEIFDFFLEVKDPQSHPLMSEYSGMPRDNSQLIYDMSLPSEIKIPYIFSRLTYKELKEFIGLHNVPHDGVGFRWAMADLAKRTYIYLYSKQGENLPVTWPVLDLLYSYRISINYDRQYKLKSLENMDDKMTKIFAESLYLDPEAPNVKERIIRILRINYLIKNY